MELPLRKSRYDPAHTNTRTHYTRNETKTTDNFIFPGKSKGKTDLIPQGFTYCLYQLHPKLPPCSHALLQKIKCVCMLTLKTTAHCAFSHLIHVFYWIIASCVIFIFHGLRNIGDFIHYCFMCNNLYTVLCSFISSHLFSFHVLGGTGS